MRVGFESLGSSRLAAPGDELRTDDFVLLRTTAKVVAYMLHLPIDRGSFLRILKMNE